MNNIDLKAIIEVKNLDHETVAKELFPTNQYPKLALNRVLLGKSMLDASQISKLSILTGLPINDLFSGSGWSTQSSGEKHKFTNGEFVAELDTETWITKVFYCGSLKHESIIHSKNVVLSEYIAALNIITLKINKND